MLITKEAFEKFRQRLELSDTEQKDAQKRHTEVRACICDGFAVDADFLSGSYRRHTKTKPLKDVDILFVLGTTEKWRQDHPPCQMLEAFATHLKKTYSGTDQIDVGRRAVTIEFEKSYYPKGHEGKVLSIDAVPAFAVAGGDYEIPDKITSTWIKTNPNTHRDQATAKNKALDGQWIPLVKMVKGWNRANGRPIRPSFLIEVMAEELVEAPFSTYPDEVRNFFAAAESTISSIWPDPAGLGPPVSDQMTPERVAEARKALQDAQRKVALASRAEASGRQGEALQLWREVLGDYFPLS
jgi:hypothetical protein